MFYNKFTRIAKYAIRKQSESSLVNPYSALYRTIFLLPKRMVVYLKSASASTCFTPFAPHIGVLPHLDQYFVGPTGWVVFTFCIL